jgi:pimeloyl-ACP methyl ester carboxylesterase
MLKRVGAGVLEVAYEECGKPGHPPVILLHGFPYDVHAYMEVAPVLASKDFHVITPYLRGYGPTRFLSSDTPRSGQQAALGHDLLALLDALDLPRAVLAGYDWGGRAACIVAALWPERVAGLVAGGGYAIQDIRASVRPQPPEQEARYWYQYYFHGERGRSGLNQNRAALCRLLWKLWSPTWEFDEATFDQSALSFENPDFVDVVIHSYRHRFGLVPGDPALDASEHLLEARPSISVPTIALDGDQDGVVPRGSAAGDDHFKAQFERRTLPQVGHNLPQEAPVAFVDAVLTVAR